MLARSDQASLRAAGLEGFLLPMGDRPVLRARGFYDTSPKIVNLTTLCGLPVKSLLRGAF
jgi:hypothetical protein